MSRMKTGDAGGERQVRDRKQQPKNERKQVSRRQEESNTDSEGDLFGVENSGWDDQIEQRISDLDSRRSQDSKDNSRRGRSRGESRSNRRGRRNIGERYQGSSKLRQAINLVVDDLKDKGYTDDFISNNRDIIRSKVKDYMREDQSRF